MNYVINYKINCCRIKKPLSRKYHSMKINRFRFIRNIVENYPNLFPVLYSLSILNNKEIYKNMNRMIDSFMDTIRNMTMQLDPLNENDIENINVTVLKSLHIMPNYLFQNIMIQRIKKLIYTSKVIKKLDINTLEKRIQIEISEVLNPEIQQDSRNKVFFIKSSQNDQKEKLLLNILYNIQNFNNSTVKKDLENSGDENNSTTELKFEDILDDNNLTTASSSGNSTQEFQ